MEASDIYRIGQTMSAKSDWRRGRLELDSQAWLVAVVMVMVVACLLYNRDKTLTDRNGRFYGLIVVCCRLPTLFVIHRMHR